MGNEPLQQIQGRNGKKMNTSNKFWYLYNFWLRLMTIFLKNTAFNTMLMKAVGSQQIWF